MPSYEKLAPELYQQARRDTNLTLKSGEREDARVELVYRAPDTRSLVEGIDMSIYFPETVLTI